MKPLWARLSARGSSLAMMVTLALVAGTFAATMSMSTARAAGVVTVTVNANEGLGTRPATGYGLNSAVWDSQMNVPQVRNLLGAAGVRMLRYPGGSYGDIYHWQTNTAPGGYVAPGTDFDSFMGTVRAVGAQPMLIANYGTGTPSEAAAWVHYANVIKGYGAKYWEIGNELYGNGYYGDDWESDNHADKSPTGYANTLLQYASAMKAVDPSIKIGAVLTLPGNWPDGVVHSGDSADWNKTVLSIAGAAIDFGIVHWYPSAANAAISLTQPSQISGELAQLRQQINSYAGAHGSAIGIAMTETDSGVDMNTQPGALFGADTYATALENGVFTVDWWDTHNGASAISIAPDGATDYGDEGLLSSGPSACVNGTCEPALNTPFPVYYAISMLSKFGLPGDTLVRTGTDQPMVAAHAVRNANGDLSVMLINKDPVNSYPIALNYAGFTPSTATPTVFRYADEDTAITSAAVGTSSSQTLPPYSIETIVLTPSASGSSLSAPGQPTVGVAGTKATIGWTPSAGGSVVRYEVYRQFGTDSELLGASTTNAVTVSNLVPGTAYTFNVLARDAAGNLSLPSTPVTFTTGTPQNSTCAVSYAVTQGWGNGFVANISITDTGPSPIDGWTFAFAFPSTTESVSGSWNGNFSENGTNVVVTNIPWNGQLAANGGNTVDIGFTGVNNGAYPSPAAFTLNGTVCATTYAP